MHVRFPAALVVLAVLQAAPALGAKTAIDPSVTVGSSRISAPGILGHVGTLANPEWNGRALASPGADSAAAYVRAQFRAAGLEPGTRQGSYYLSYPVPTAARVQGVIGLRDRRRGYTFGRDWSPLGFTSMARALGPLAVAGYGLTVPEAGYDDYSGLDVAGKVVLVLSGEPPRRQGALSESQPSLYAEPFTKALNARRHGAAGMIIIGPPPGPGGASPTWRINQEQGFPDAGIPACHLSWAAAESLLSGSGLDLAALRRGQPAVAGHFSTESACDSVELVSGLRRLDGTAIDVVGRLPGKTGAGTVLVTAAYDGWGGGNDSSHPVPHPGAGDNGAGTALLIEIAAAMRGGLPLDRSILFVAYSGRVFDAAGIAPVLERLDGGTDPVVAVIDLAGFGARPAERLFVSGSGSSPAWPEIWEGVAKLIPDAPEVRLVKDSPSWGALPRWREAGVPAVLVSTGGAARFGTPTDTPGELDPAGLANIGRVIHGVVRALGAETTQMAGSGVK